jgi:ferrous iron transport protein B
MSRPTIALMGNPNTGKTSIFNALTGSRQHTANWPGKTVLRRSGECDTGRTVITIVDLPGAYSLTPVSPEEVIARDYLLSGEPGAALIVLDAANLERNLFLAVQILEFGILAVVALNMVDVAERKGMTIDPDRLSRRLGTPVIPTVARTGTGIDALVAALGRLTEATAVS